MIKCSYCRALVCSGEHDWVLGEITQVEEWRPIECFAPGLSPTRARDPGLAREVLEDRGSYVFWKWIQAGRMQSVAPLRRCASASRLASDTKLEWIKTVRDVAVGGAELVRFALDRGEGFDCADVEIRWSAGFGASSAFQPMQTVVRLARRSGVSSTLSMTALACRACAHP